MPQGELEHTRRVLAEAMELHRAEELFAAEAKYVAVVEAGYRPAEILPILIRLAADRGDLVLALARLDALLKLEPANAGALGEKGALLHRLKAWDEAVDCLEAAVALAPQNTHFLTNLAAALADAGRKERARKMHARVAELEPANPMAQHQLRRASAALVPFWHIPMLNDDARNDAFERALQRAITTRGPDALVLDIGSGSGLLAMMAARAGARRVISCEAVEAIAAVAREIIERNGYGEQVTIINKRSTELVVGRDLPAQASILVSEILSSDLLAEHVLETFEDAQARLLTSDAAIIPRSVEAMGCLIESPQLARYAFVEKAAGFDVSLFTTLAAQRIPVPGEAFTWRQLAEPRSLVGIDLAARQNPSYLEKIEIPVTASGVATGILQWLNIRLDGEVSFATSPHAYSHGGWQLILHTFPKPIAVQAEDTFSVAVGHDRTSLVVVPMGVAR